MAVAIRDAGVSTAVAQALGHKAPFEAAECARIESLVVKRAKDLSELSHCSSLRRLEVFASEFDDLGPLSSLAHLRELTVLCTAVNDISVLGGCEALEMLDLSFTLAEDATAISEMPALKCARLIGNPWTSDAFAGLQRRVVGRSGRSPLLQISSKWYWKVTREMNDAKLALCYDEPNGIETVLVRPGIPSIKGLECDYVRLGGASWAFDKRDAKLGTNKYFARFDGFRKKDKLPPFDFRNHVTLADAEQADKWIEQSSLPAPEKKALRRFVTRFRAAVFYREEEPLFDQFEARHQVRLPRWLRDRCRVVAGAFPGKPRSLQFDGFDKDILVSSDVGELWYQLQRQYDEKDQQQLLQERCGALLIARETEKGYSRIVAALADSGPTHISEMDEENVSSMIHDGADPKDGMNLAFSSYASMLSHVAHIKFVDDNTVIDALADRR